MKRLICLILSLALCLGLLTSTAWAAESEFVIEDGVLTNYHGPGGDVVIPEGVTAIGEYAFGFITNTYDRSAVTSVTIPASVTTIDKRAFQYCDGLRQVNFSEGLTYIAEYAFEGCSALQQVNLPDGLTYIAEFTFSNCKSLTSVNIPSSVRYIDSSAFRGCSALSAITCSDSVMIDRSAFVGCDLVPERYRSRYITSEIEDLTPEGFWIDSDGVLYKYSGEGGDVVIPSHVNKIEDTAFLGCTSLTSVVIPDSVVFLGDNAFSGCTNLERVTLGTGLVFLNGEAFGGKFTRGSTTYTGCPSLKEVRFPALSEQNPALRYSEFSSAFRYSSELDTIVNCPQPEVADRRAANDRILAAWQSANLQVAVVPQSERVTVLSNQICDGLTSDYAKAEAVYHWLSENIEYDYDYYYNRKQNVTIFPEEVIDTKLTVCDGYSRLTQALLQAQGIPTLRITGLADGLGGWEAHAWNLAYVDGHWIYMDTTWGSKSGGNSDTTNVRWFDPTPLFLAFSHKGEEAHTNPGGHSGDETPSETMFADVATSAYYAQPVQWAVEKGITAGTSSTTFSPDATCTTAEILTFLWRSQGQPEPSIKNPFSDVTPGAYYYQAALWAYEKGLISGAAFRGDTPCTRSATVTYLWKLAGSPPSSYAAFTDVPDTADCAQAVAWAVSKDITSGTSANTFSPEMVCSRSQIVTFLYRIYK